MKLNITGFPLHIHEAFPMGWLYSAFVFLGVNLLLLVMIAMLYTALLISSIDFQNQLHIYKHFLEWFWNHCATSCLP